MIFSRLSIYRLDSIKAYLELEWSENISSQFFQKLNERLKTIEQNPFIYPASEKDIKLRKCVISKQTSLYYEIQDDRIYVLDVIDNRQDPNEIQSEIDRLF